MKEVLTTYLTKKGDPQRAKKIAALPNNEVCMIPWYPACDSGVVFHDELSEEFISKYPRTQFVKVTEYPYSCNDGRFGLFQAYLEKNPGVDEVWMTDLFDVKVNYLPKIEKGMLFVSNEGQDWHMDTPWMREKHRLFDTSALQGRLVYNPGVWGGHRDIVLPILDEITKQFCRIKVGSKNANMVVFNKVIHSLDIPIITGYPLHTKFKSYQNDEKAAFQHK